MQDVVSFTQSIPYQILRPQSFHIPDRHKKGKALEYSLDWNQ